MKKGLNPIVVTILPPCPIIVVVVSAGPIIVVFKK
jgi:hypothetical protein